jgi:hypothetical protein
VKTGNPNIVVAAAGWETLYALATRRRLVELCRALDEWEPPEL